MINMILRWLRGYVIFEATGKFPERLINLALSNDITLINPLGEKGKLTAQVSISDYRQLCDIRERATVKLKIIKKVGLPFIIHHNRNRKGVFVGFIFFAVIIHILSMFIWTIDIKGNKYISMYEIENTLRNNGIYVGAMKKDINVKNSERNFALQLGQIGWMSVNIMGSTAEVELSESYEKPKITQQDKPCNLKAKKSGQVLKMNVNSGKNIVSVGDGVAKGQLLVSGIIDIGDTGTSKFVHSDGEIYAGVTEKNDIAVNKNVTYGYISELKQRRVIKLLNFKFPLDYSKVDNVYRKKYVTDSFVLNNINMPFNIVTEENFGINTKKININKSQAEQIANIKFSLDDVFKYWDSDIKSKNISFNENKDSYIFTAEYYCIEDIAETVDIDIVN